MIALERFSQFLQNFQTKHPFNGQKASLCFLNGRKLLFRPWLKFVQGLQHLNTLCNEGHSLFSKFAVDVEFSSCISANVGRYCQNTCINSNLKQIYDITLTLNNLEFLKQLFNDPFKAGKPVLRNQLYIYATCQEIQDLAIHNKNKKIKVVHKVNRVNHTNLQKQIQFAGWIPVTNRYRASTFCSKHYGPQIKLLDGFLECKTAWSPHMTTMG